MRANDTILNKRQDAVLAFIEREKKVSIGRIFGYIEKEFGNITRITVSRDLGKIMGLGLIQRGGSGRGVFYVISSQYATVKKIDVEKYFSIDQGKREIIGKFNFGIFDRLKNIFTEKEKRYLADLNDVYRDKIKKMPPDALRKETERLSIDFSWKSSEIEGNTYSLLETEQLIKNQTLAKGHAKEEAIMILNHKKALEYIRENKNDFRVVSVSKIENIHAILVGGLDVTKGLRKTLVRITGTDYVPLDNEFQIREALDKACGLINGMENVFEKAVIMMLLISYIQPFVDGNKRTGRLSGNAILQALDVCPLSYRSMADIEYKKAVLLFYEQNNVAYFKELFLEQFEFAVNNYFG